MGMQKGAWTRGKTTYFSKEQMDITPEQCAAVYDAVMRGVGKLYGTAPDATPEATERLKRDNVNLSKMLQRLNRPVTPQE